MVAAVAQSSTSSAGFPAPGPRGPQRTDVSAAAVGRMVQGSPLQCRSAAGSPLQGRSGSGTPLKGQPGDLAQRRRDVIALVGDAVDDDSATFRAVLSPEVERLFNEAVLGAVRPVWPGIDASPFLAKWRGGFDLYASLALSCIVCSANRPLVVSAGSRLARLLSLDERGVVGFGRRAIPFVFRFAERKACHRAALVSAWILVLDEALDDGLAQVELRERPRVLASAMRGTLPDVSLTTPELAAVHALGEAVRRAARDADDRAHLARVVDDVEAWADCEVQNLLGVPDPHGVSHRTIGITASMDLLGWAVSPYAGPKEHQFLYRIAELGQMVDDWLDVDKDRAQGRDTPATAGIWDLATMASTLAAAEAVLHELADDAGEPALSKPGSAFRGLLVKTFRGQIQHMARCLVENP